MDVDQGWPPKFEAQLSKRSVCKISTNFGVCNLQFERLTRMRGRSTSFFKEEKDPGNISTWFYGAKEQLRFSILNNEF